MNLFIVVLIITLVLIMNAVIIYFYQSSIENFYIQDALEYYKTNGGKVMPLQEGFTTNPNCYHHCPYPDERCWPHSRCCVQGGANIIKI